MKAFIFPGQGSQKVGMGTDLADASSHAREVFQEVDEALKQKLSAVMREGPESGTDAHLQRATRNHGELDCDVARAGARVRGEAGGCRRLRSGTLAGRILRAVRCWQLRPDHHCQAAAPARHRHAGRGADRRRARWRRLLGADIEKATALAEAAAHGQICEVANDNDPTQVVISGHYRSDRPRHRNGEGPWHQARHKIARVCPVPLLADAACCTEDEDERWRRRRRMLPHSAAVRQRHRCQRDRSRRRSATCSSGRSPAASAGARACSRWSTAEWSTFVEVGGKVLAPMVGRIAPDARTTSLVTMDDLEAFAKEHA